VEERMKPGERVTRYLSSARVPAEAVVVEVTDEVIKVTAPGWYEEGKVPEEGMCWTYCAKSGAEIDEELGWGPKFGVTGSFIDIRRGEGKLWDKVGQKEI
jgi:hypothetical protein